MLGIWKRCHGCTQEVQRDADGFGRIPRMEGQSSGVSGEMVPSNLQQFGIVGWEKEYL